MTSLKKCLFVSCLAVSAIVCSGIEPLPTYDWAHDLQMWPGRKILTDPTKNIFPFHPRDKAPNKEAQVLIKNVFQGAQAVESDAEILSFALSQVEISGAYIELGVATGMTINALAILRPYDKIYGFDSFEGLPMDWDRTDVNITKGTFASKGNFIPPVLRNVQLFKGAFDNVLPQFKEKYLGNRPIAFLHVDCDLYESTRDAFVALEENIVSGTIMVFDEFYNYPNYEKHEWKALQEFLERTGRKVSYIAYNINHEQVAIRIL